MNLEQQMIDQTLPDNKIDKVDLLQNILINRATGRNGIGDGVVYQKLRHDLTSDSLAQKLLPDFIRTCRDLDHFWQHIKSRAPTYRERREIIWSGLQPLLDHLEAKNQAPADAAISSALQSFDAEGVHAVWEKALQRRSTDPEGAITSARTLLETVCKRILDEQRISYNDSDELPALYHNAANTLNLAPSQHTEESFRAILGSAQQIVGRLGSLRNKIGDAHGKGGKPIKPLARHAALAVNMAGTMATFLVETWIARQAAKKI